MRQTREKTGRDWDKNQSDDKVGALLSPTFYDIRTQCLRYAPEGGMYPSACQVGVPCSTQTA